MTNSDLTGTPRRAPPKHRQPHTLRGGLLAVAAVVIVVSAGAAVVHGRGDVDAASPSAPLAQSPVVPAPRDPGNYVRTRVASDGRLTTEQYIVTAEPVELLTVSVRGLGDYDDVAAVSQLMVSELTVTADGQELDRSDVELDGTAATEIDLGSPSTVIVLRYVTEGGVIRSTPSESERALVVANPLMAEVGAPVTRDLVRLDGPKVLSLACVLDGRLPQPCGRPDDTGWRVLLEPANAAAVVLAQVDLPQA